MASETVKVFKTDQEQEEDTLPEEVNHKYAMFSLIFELFTTWFHEKLISNFYQAIVGCDQVLNKKNIYKEIF